MDLFGRSRGEVYLVIMVAMVLLTPSFPWEMPLASPAETAPTLLDEAPSPLHSNLEARRSTLSESQRESLQQRLDPGTLVVAFQVGHAVTEVSLIDRNDVQVETLPIGYQRLASQVDHWVSYVLEARRPETAFYNKFESLAELLYAELLGPIEGRLEAGERWVFIPDGPLHRLPFSCLKRTGETETRPFLVQWKPFQTAPSIDDYLDVLASGGAALDGGSQLAAFGDADYGFSASAGDASRPVGPFRHRGTSDWASIPGSGDEVRSIATTFPLHRLFLGKDATKEQLQALAEVDVLHLSTHGVQGSPRTGQAALLLSPKRLEGRPVVGSERLEIGDILAGDVPRAKLVVLSACDSALGTKPTAGSPEDGRGLGWAFLENGSRSVVSSLWKVDDRHTVQLMQRFYHYLGSGLPQGDALQLAQIDLIEGSGGTAQAPYIWAAFQMQGHWR